MIVEQSRVMCCWSIDSSDCIIISMTMMISNSGVIVYGSFVIDIILNPFNSVVLSKRLTNFIHYQLTREIPPTMSIDFFVCRTGHTSRVYGFFLRLMVFSCWFFCVNFYSPQSHCIKFDVTSQNNQLEYNFWRFFFAFFICYVCFSV